MRDVRKLYRDTQTQFARRIGCAMITISRFETGRSEPRDKRVLLRLADVAREKGSKFEILFREAFGEQAGKDWDRFRRAQQLESIPEWRLICAARLTWTYFREDVQALEKAVSRALLIVDEVLRKADKNNIDYKLFEGEAFALAAQQMVGTEKDQSQ